MASLGTSSSADISIPELVGVPSLRKSLGQFQGILHRQIDVIIQDCHLADPHKDGTDSRCNQQMIDILNVGLVNLEIAYKKWNLRLDQLLEEDPNADNLTEYREKWKKISPDYSEAKALIITTICNIKKPTSFTQNEQETAIKIQPIKPISELKPFQLEKMSSPGRFHEWKRRFESFFIASNLQKAPIVTQQAYFRQCISSQLANLLDSHISQDLSVYPDPNIAGDDSCIGLLQKEIEKRHPLTLRRLALFSTKQNVNMSFTDYVAIVKKKSETADISNFNSDNILSYILLSGCSDQGILEEVLKLSKNPDFEQLVKIGTNLEVSRSILQALPGTHQSRANLNSSYKLTGKKNYDARSHAAQKNDINQDQPSKIFKSTNYMIEDMKKRNICIRCGKFKCINMKNCPMASKTCDKCNRRGHIAPACAAEGQNRARNRSVSFEPNRASRNNSQDGRQRGNSYKRSENSSRNSSLQRGRTAYKKDGFQKNSFKQVTNDTANEFGELAELLGETAKLENRVYMIKNQASIITAGTPTPRIKIKLGPNYQTTTECKIRPFFSAVLADSGASRSICPYSLVKDKNIKFMDAPNDILVDAQNNRMDIKGRFYIEAMYQDKKVLIDCLISDSVEEFIVSWYDAIALGLHLAIENAAKSEDSKNSAFVTLDQVEKKENLAISAEMLSKDKIAKKFSSAALSMNSRLVTPDKVLPYDAQKCLNSALSIDKISSNLTDDQLKSFSPKYKKQKQKYVILPHILRRIDYLVSNKLKQNIRYQRKPSNIKMKNHLLKLQNATHKAEELYKQLDNIDFNNTLKKVHFRENAVYLTETKKQDRNLDLKPEDFLPILLEEFGDVFKDELGNRFMKVDPVKITLKKGEHKFPRPCSVAKSLPLFQHRSAEETLRNALKSGIIERVPISEPAPTLVWRAMFVQKHSGKSRLVCNFSGLNKEILRPYHNFPSASEILKSLPHDAHCYASFDLSHGYHQILMDNESKKLTTFLLPRVGNDPGGLFRYRSLPMGLSCSSDLFCKATDIAFRQLEHHFKLVDDVLLYASNYPNLLEKCRKFLQKCREFNIIVSPTKFKAATEIKYAGSIISAQGVQCDPTYLANIYALKPPSNQSMVRSFLGMCNQIAPYVVDLSKITLPIRELLQKNTAFNWTSIHQAAFDKVKQILTGPKVLHHFNPKLAPVIMTDACFQGLGYCLLQYDENDVEEKRPKLIVAGGRGLTPAESNWSVCEIETLGLVYALKKLRHFIAGCQSVKIRVDHKPLLGLFSKSIDQIENKRLQRLREKVLHINLDIQFVPGINNNLADYISRSAVFKPIVSMQKTPFKPEQTNKQTNKQTDSYSQQQQLPGLVAAKESPCARGSDMTGRVLSTTNPDRVIQRASESCFDHNVLTEEILDIESQSVQIPQVVAKVLQQMGNPDHFAVPGRRFSSTNTGLPCSMFRYLLEVSLSDKQYQNLVDCVRKKTTFINLPPILKKEVCSNIYPNMSVFSKSSLYSVWTPDQIINRQAQKSISEPGLLLVDNERIFVPKILRQEILKRIHMGHPGRNKSLRFSRRFFYWPGLSQDIINQIDKCEVCKTHLPAQKEAPLCSSFPEYASPFSMLGMDVFHANGLNYLALICRMSGFPFCFKLKSTTSESIIKALDSLFTVFGYPVNLRTDGASYFTSHTFQTYLKNKGINHELSSPLRPSSNGISEQAVAILKKLLSKCAFKWDTFNDHLAQLRACPRNDGFSAAELFLGRCIRTNLPLLPKAYSFNFKRALAGYNARLLNLSKLQAQTQETRNILDDLRINQRVAVYADVGTSAKWSTRARVIGFVRPSLTAAINYHVAIEGKPSKTYVRSRIHLLKVPESEDPGEAFISEALGHIQLASPDQEVHKREVQDYILALRRNPNRSELLKANGLEQLLHEYLGAEPHLEAIRNYVFDNEHGDFYAYEDRPRTPESPPPSGDLTELVPPMSNPYAETGSQLSSPDLAGLCLEEVLSAEDELPIQPKSDLPAEKGSSDGKIHSETGAVSKHPQGLVGGRYFLRPRDDMKALNKVHQIAQQSVASSQGEESVVKISDQKRKERIKSLRFKIVKTHRQWSDHSSGQSSHKVTYTYLPLSDSD